ncbi:MAG: tail fiber domain-containing protein [Deltaproteobacteria bacterium]|nr:tail fiber domain-containing protein [Deltaproteobacteria bacterium]
MTLKLRTATRSNEVSYEWRRDEFPNRWFHHGRQLGFIAQEVEEVLPEIVKTEILSSRTYKSR